MKIHGAAVHRPVPGICATHRLNADDVTGPDAGAAHTHAVMMEEKSYRRLLDDTFARIDRAFNDVDPDLAESNLSQGALIITMRQKQRLVLSPQPSPRQLWLAFRDRAWHFDWNESRACWLDDRGQNIEALALVTQLTKDAAGVDLPLSQQ
jgi:iron donor protein CyaY